MGKFEKIITRLLSGNADNNFDFDDLVNILLQVGFTKKGGKGSHQIFYKDGIPEIINIQPLGSKAKAYQVKQVRSLILKYKLADDEF